MPMRQLSTIGQMTQTTIGHHTYFNNEQRPYHKISYKYLSLPRTSKLLFMLLDSINISALEPESLTFSLPVK